MSTMSTGTTMNDDSAEQDHYQRAARRLADMASLVTSGLAPDDAALRVRVQDVATTPHPPAAPLGDSGALARVAATLDVDGLRRVLDEGFALGTFEEVVDGWLLPSLHRLGQAWEDGEVGVAEEHFASASVHRRLAMAYDETPTPLHAPTVLVGLAPGSRHELGVLAFATALRRRGVDTVYLGGDVPVSAWLAAVQRRRPEGVVIAVPGREDVPASRGLVAALAESAPGLTVLIGGGQQDQVDGDVTPLGHQMLPAAERLARALRAKV